MCDQGVADNQGPLFIDVTTLDSTGGWKKFIESQKEGEEITLEMTFEPAPHDVMYIEFGDGTSIEIPISDVDAISTRFSITEGQFKHPFQERKR